MLTLPWSGLPPRIRSLSIRNKTGIQSGVCLPTISQSKEDRKLNAEAQRRREEFVHGEQQICPHMSES
jgi:hypothetical protein